MSLMPSLGDTRLIDDIEHTWSRCRRCGGTGVFSYRFREGSTCDLCHGKGEAWQALEVTTVSPCSCCASRGCGCDAMEPEGPNHLFEVCGCCWDTGCECQGGVLPELVFIVPPGGVVLDLTLEKYT